jgi:hypothetical protein
MSLAQYQQAFYALAFAQPNDWQALLADTTHPAMAHLQATPLPRLAQYRTMVLANYQETLEAIFPYTHQLLSTPHSQAWEALVRRYLQTYPPNSFALQQAGKAFAQFLSEQAPLMQRFPFLSDLATYEYLEAVLLHWPATPAHDLPKDLQPLDTVAHLPAEVLGQYRPVLIEASRSLTTHYPINAVVQALNAQDAEAFVDEAAAIAPSPLHLWVYRAEAGRVSFLQVSPFLQSLLATYQQGECSLEEGLHHVCQAQGIATPAQGVQQLLGVLLPLCVGLIPPQI